MKENIHYQIIVDFYGGRSAERSGVPLINHINEGLLILEHLNTSINVKEAFCLHPLLQSNNDLKKTLSDESKYFERGLSPKSIILAMEYRSTANNYLSIHCKGENDRIILSEIPYVNDMLVADKVQNRKDFEIYHKGTHPNSEGLDMYFKNWLKALNISEGRYQTLSKCLDC